MDEGAIVGTVLLTEKDLEVAMRDTSWLFQPRKAFVGIFAVYAGMAIWGTVSAHQEWYQALPQLFAPASAHPPLGA